LISVKETKVPQATIDEWKESGVYHVLFSTADVVVTEHVRSSEVELKAHLDELRDEIVELCFKVTSADGEPKVYQADLSQGKPLVHTVAELDRFFKNLLQRMRHCIPTPGQHEWWWTGDRDANGFRIYKPYIKTGGNESWNEVWGSLLDSESSGPGLGTAVALEANPRFHRERQRYQLRRNKAALALLPTNDRVDVALAVHAAHSQVPELGPAPGPPLPPMGDVGPNEVFMFTTAELPTLERDVTANFKVVSVAEPRQLVPRRWVPTAAAAASIAPTVQRGDGSDRKRRASPVGSCVTCGVSLPAAKALRLDPSIQQLPRMALVAPPTQTTPMSTTLLKYPCTCKLGGKFQPTTAASTVSNGKRGYVDHTPGCPRHERSPQRVQHAIPVFGEKVKVHFSTAPKPYLEYVKGKTWKWADS
jgi:hypothetical protein